MLLFYREPKKVLMDGQMNNFSDQSIKSIIVFHVNMFPQLLPRGFHQKLLNLFNNNPYMTNTPNLNRHVYGTLRIDSLEVESWVNIPEVIVELYDNETARNGS